MNNISNHLGQGGWKVFTHGLLLMASWGLRGAALGDRGDGQANPPPYPSELRPELSGLYAYPANAFLQPFLPEKQWLATSWPGLQHQEVPHLPAQDRQALVREALLLGHLGYLEALVKGAYLLRIELPLEELWLALARPRALTQGPRWNWRKTEKIKAYIDRVIRLKTGQEEAHEAQGQAEGLGQVAQALFPFLLFVAWAAQTQQGLPLGRAPAPCFLAEGQVEQWARLLREIGVPDTEAIPLSLGLWGPLAPSPYMAVAIAELLEEKEAKATYLEGVLQLALPKRLCTWLTYLLESCQVNRLSVAYPAQLQAIVEEQYLGIRLPIALCTLIFDHVDPLRLHQEVFDALPVYSPLYHTLRGYGACPPPPSSKASWRVWGVYCREELRFQAGAFMRSSSRLDRWWETRLTPLLPSTQEREDLSCFIQHLLLAMTSLSLVGNPYTVFAFFLITLPGWMVYGLALLLGLQKTAKFLMVAGSLSSLAISFVRPPRWLLEGMRLGLPLIHPANRFLTNYPFYYLWGHEAPAETQPLSSSLKHSLLFVLPCSLMFSLYLLIFTRWLERP